MDDKDRKMEFDVDEVIVKGIEELGASVQNKEPLMTEETFQRISSMSPAELERLIEELEKKYRGFRNLIGKRGANGIRFHEEGPALTPRERTPEGSVPSVSSILVDDSMDICDNFRGGKRA